ncbi:bifunctional diguanylate cyclase/phosphodiesterase [Shewanella sp. NIFS-20-20]|uniref:putative bifunctional diguanylate cyclase/phosphodiesterase n=1 Tax=Shewanella sp. NIFS-20-20 TaxID=2853806 RepID=UPI001C46066B|nr:EAL domain-containing protein [Shewanella sp. NIFS-20-20]MBV7316661.1 EAL domain-containing protein [Shewanella sp. NIFS-20-20]
MSQWQQLLNPKTVQAHSQQTPALALLSQGRILECTPEFAHFLALPPKDIIGADVSQLSARLQSNGQESLTAISQWQPAEQHQFSWLFIGGNNQEKLMHCHLSATHYNDSHCHLLAIHPLERRQQRRNEPNNETTFSCIPREVLDASLGHSAEAVYITNAQRRIIAANNAMFRLSGYSQQQLIGMDQHQLFFEGQTGLRPLELGTAWQGEVLKLKADGGRFPAWLSQRWLTSNDGVDYCVNIFSDITAKKALQQQLTYQATHDSLTGLANRRQLKLSLQTALANIADSNTQMGALMFMDLNGFKNINDCFGHAMGDRVLQLVAARLEAGCPEDNLCFRLGGDEFTLLIEKCRSREQVAALARQVLSLFDTPFELEGQKFYLGTSIGITLFPEHGQHASQLISRADTAMYSAKKQSDKVVFYDKTLQLLAEQKVTYLNALRHALSLNQFVLYYQAIISTVTGELMAAETLLRWQMDSDKLIEAVDFIPQLEDSGLIVNVGHWVLIQACSQAAAWQKEYNKSIQISVNVSPLQLEHPDFIEHVEHALKQANLAPELLILEITESALVRQPEQAKATLSQLKQMGIAIAIDDFGSGLSSLSRLSSLPIDSIKIDAEFTRQMDSDTGVKFCQAIVDLTKALALNFVAEGIETERQWQHFKSMGQGFGQGYLFNYPCRASEFNQRYLI